MTPTRDVLVLGATGNQGRAVATALLERGHRVAAFVRDPTSKGAQALAERGARLVQGDYDRPNTITAAARGRDAVFVNTSPFLPGVGLGGEVRQGCAIVDALGAAAVPHLVYSSVSDAHRNTGVPHFDSKARVEAYLAASRVPHTVTGPVFFTDNLLMPWNLPSLRRGVLRHAMAPDRPLQVVSLHDIGHFNATVIERGQTLAGRRFDYAGDELSSRQMAQVLAEVTGRPIRFEAQPIREVAAFDGDMAAMFRWFDDVGYSAEISALREAFPEVGWQSFRNWASGRDWPRLLTEPEQGKEGSG